MTVVLFHKFIPLKIFILLIFLYIFANNVSAKRRTGARNWQFDARPGMGNLVLEGTEEEDETEEDDNEGIGIEQSNNEKSTTATTATDGTTIVTFVTKLTAAVTKSPSSAADLEQNMVQNDMTVGSKGQQKMEDEEEKATKELLDKAINVTAEDEDQLLKQQQQIAFDDDEIWRNLSLLPGNHNTHLSSKLTYFRGQREESLLGGCLIQSR
jgi:hypothetical protein